MAGCNPFSFRLDACAWSLVDSIGAALPWPVWLVIGLIVVGIVWHFAGTPGLVGLAGLVGFMLGRRSVVETDEIWPPPDRGKRKPVPKRKTILDIFKSRR